MRSLAPIRLLRWHLGLVVISALLASACASPPIRVSPTAASTTALPLEVTQTTLPPESDRRVGPAASLVTAPQGAAVDAGDNPATTQSGRLGAAAVPNPAGVVLDRDGLGIVSFGAAVEPALRLLMDALGQPVTDTGWIDPFSIYGDCPGSQLRVVEWPGVLALFGDPDDRYAHRDPGGEHFMSWRLGTFGPDPYMLRTAAGIGVGSTRDQVAAAYPAVTFAPGEGDTPPSVVLDAAVGELTGFFGAGGRVATLEAGTRCASR